MTRAGGTALAVFLPALLVGFMAPAPVPRGAATAERNLADPRLVAADTGGYADSVDRALDILRAAPGDDRTAARRAADVLAAGTGQTQPEILTDLRRDPPNVADARDRLS